jgi:hypothetical protein
VVHIYNPRAWEVEAECFQVQGQPWAIIDPVSKKNLKKYTGKKVDLQVL